MFLASQSPLSPGSVVVSIIKNISILAFPNLVRIVHCVCFNWQAEVNCLIQHNSPKFFHFCHFSWLHTNRGDGALYIYKYCEHHLSIIIRPLDTVLHTFHVNTESSLFTVVITVNQCQQLPDIMISSAQLSSALCDHAWSWLWSPVLHCNMFDNVSGVVGVRLTLITGHDHPLRQHCSGALVTIWTMTMGGSTQQHHSTIREIVLDVRCVIETWRHNWRIHKL